MGLERKPEDIKESIRKDNVFHLSAAGRKGAEKTNDLTRVKKAKDELAEELRSQAEHRRMLDSNEHLSPPPGPFD